MHLSSHECNFWRAWPHIRRFMKLDFQAEMALHSQREAQMIAFRNRYFMRRMFDRLGQATGVFPPEMVECSDEDELAHRYPNDSDSDSDSDSDINSEPQSDVKLINYQDRRGRSAPLLA